MHPRRVATWLIGLMLASALAAVAMAVGNAEPGHMPLHVGCKHHSHGSKWHADHGRILGASRTAGESADRDALLARSLTAGRTWQHPGGTRRD